jgi:nucleoside-diphosphate-sugar epimerase
VFLNAFQNKNFPITIVRPAYTYDTIVPIYIGHNCFTAPQMYRDGYPILIAGDGTTLFAFTHSSDLAAALSGLFMNDRAIGEAFHITTDRWLTWLDAMGILAETLGVKSPRFLRIPSEDILKMEVPVSANMGISFLGKAFYFQKMWCDIYDNRKIKTAVPGWQAVKTFEQGIGETISWLDEKDVRRRINPDLQALLLDLTKKYS